MGKNNHVNVRPRRGGRTITKMYSSGVNGMKEHIFNCCGHKDTTRFKKTKKELYNHILQILEKGEPDVVKTVHTLQSEDLTPA